MSISETKIVNLALSEIGAKRINNLDTDTSARAINARTHYEQARDSLIRSHYWRFASARKTLSEDTVSPDFEYSNQFILPNDFMRLKNVWSGHSRGNTNRSFAVEGQRLLIDDSSVSIRYIRKVTDPTEFDSLFIEVLTLQLALKFSGGIAGTDIKLKEDIKQRFAVLMRQVRAIDRQETNTKGREDQGTWNDARFRLGNRIDSQLGSGS